MYNHQSYVDAAVITTYFAPSGIAKASIANLPVIGTITVALQFLFVQRRGSADKTNRHTQAAGRTVEKLAERAADTRRALCASHQSCAILISQTQHRWAQRRTLLIAVEAQ